MRTAKLLLHTFVGVSMVFYTLATALLAVPSVANAQTAGAPATIGYNGRLFDDSGNALTGTYYFWVDLESAISGGTNLASNIQVFADADGDGALDDGSEEQISVTNGFFTFEIPLSTDIADFANNVYLEIKVHSAEVVGSAETLSPRVKVTKTPYAIVSQAIERSSDDPTTGFEGRMYYDTDEDELKFYDGTATSWVTLASNLDDAYNNDSGERTVTVDDGDVSYDLAAAGSDFIIDTQSDGDVIVQDSGSAWFTLTDGQAITTTGSGAVSVASTAGNASLSATDTGDAGTFNVSLIAGDTAPDASEDGNDVVLEAEDDVLVEATGAFDVDAGAASAVTTSAGALTLDGNGGVNIAGNAAEIDLTTTGALDLNSAAGTWDSSAGIALTGATASSFTTSAGDLTLLADTGSVIVKGDEAASDAILLDADSTAGSGVYIDAYDGTNNTSGVVQIDATTIDINGVGGVGNGFDVDVSGTGASINFDTTDGDISLQASGSTGDVSVASAQGDISVNTSSNGRIINIGSTNFSRTVNVSTGTGNDSINIGNNGTGNKSIAIGNNTGTSSLDLNSGTGNVDIDTTGEIQIDGGLTDIGSGTYTAADGDNDLGVAGDLEINGDTYLDDLIVESGARIGTGSTADSFTALDDDTLFVEGAFEVDGTARFDGVITALADADFDATGGSSGDPDFSVDGYALFADVLDLNGSVDFDGTTVDVVASGAISLDAGAASNFNVTAGSLTFANTDADDSGDENIVFSAGDTAPDAGEDGDDVAIEAEDDFLVQATDDADFDVAAFLADATEGISLDAGAASNFTTSAGALTLDGNGGVNIAGNAAEVDVTTTGAVDVNSAAGTWDSSAGLSLDAATASNFTTAAGALTLDGNGGVNIAGNAAEVDVTTTGAVDVNSAAGTWDASAGISLDAAGASNFNTTAGNLTFASTDGDDSGDESIVLSAGDTAPDAGEDGDDVAVEAEDDFLVEATDDVNVDAGGDILADATGAISIDAGTASNFTTAAGALTLDGNGGVNIAGNAAEVDITTTGAYDVNSGAWTWNGSTALLTSTSTFGVDSTGAVNIDSDAGFTAGGSTMTLAADGGVFDVDATGALSLNSSGAAINIGNDAVAQAINMGTGAAARTITIGNATGATQIALDAGTGGVDVDLTATGPFAIDGDLTVIGNGGTDGDVADGDNDLLVTGVLEVDTELEVDGSLDADGSADFSGGVTNSASEFLFSGGNLQLNDSIVLSFGSDDDASITHNATNTVVSSGTGDLVLDNTNATGTTLFTLGSDDGNTQMVIEQDGGTDLFTFDGDGDLTIAGVADGTDALTLTAGDLTLTDGDLSVAGGDFDVVLDAGDTAGITNSAATADGFSVSYTSTDAAGLNAAVIGLTAANGTDRTARGLFVNVTSQGTAASDVTKGIVVDLASTAGATDTAIEIGTTAAWDIGLDMAGTRLDLDADNDTSINAGTDDQIDIEIAGANDFQFTANAFTVLSGSQINFVDTGENIAGDGTDLTISSGGDIILTPTGSDVQLGTANLNGTNYDITGADGTASFGGGEIALDADGALNINDDGDAGALNIEGTVLDINSLDFAAAGAITTTGDAALTFTIGGDDNAADDFIVAANNFDLDASGNATFAGDITVTGGDVNGGNGEYINIGQNVDDAFTLVSDDSDVVLNVADDTDANTGLTINTAGTGNLTLDTGGAGVINIGTGSALGISLGANGTTTIIDMNGIPVDLDADGDTSIAADTDDQIDFEIGGSDKLVLRREGAADHGSTISNAALSFTPNAHSAGTNTDIGLFVDGTIPNATGGTNTARLLALGASDNTIEGDAEFTVEGLSISQADGAGTMHAISIGSGWDNYINSQFFTVAGTGGVTSAGTYTSTSDDAALFLQPDGDDTDFYIGVDEDDANDDNDTFVIGDGSSVTANQFLTIETDGTISFTGDTNIGNAASDDLTINGETSARADAGADADVDVFTITVDGEDAGDDQTQRALVIVNADSGTDTDNGADSLITLDNEDANDPVDVGIDFDLSAAGGFTDDISLQNGETINNATNGTVLIEDGGATTLASMSTTDFQINLGAAQNNAQRLCHSGADSATGVVSLGDCTGTSIDADYAENYPVAEDVEYAEIIALGTKQITTTQGDVITQGVKSTVPYQSTALGIVRPDSNDDVTVVGYNIADEDNPKPLALAGRVPVKVVSEGGSVQVGDFLTTSSTPGAAMKATQSGRVIGMALENWDGSSETVMVQVANTWYTPSDSASNALQGGNNTSVQVVSADSVDVADGSFSGSITVAEHLYGSRDMAGRVRMASGETRVRVTFETEYQFLPIVTFSSRSNSLDAREAWISDEDTTGFTLNRPDSTSGAQVEFNWIAVGVEDAQVTVSDLEDGFVQISVNDLNGPSAPAPVEPSEEEEVVEEPAAEEVVEEAAAEEPAAEEVVEEAPAEEEVVEEPAAEEVVEEAAAEEPAAEEVVEEAPAEEEVVEEPAAEEVVEETAAEESAE